MNADILKQWTAQALSMRPYPNKMFPPSPYYRFFEVMAQNLKPSLSVVLGVSGGGDCLHLARGWSDGTVVGIDHVNDHPANIRYILDRHPNFLSVIGDSVELANSINRLYGPVDILFIDTVHTYEQTMKEYNAWQPYLSDKSIVCLDDLFRPEGMQQAWDEMPEPKLRLDMLHDGAEFGGGFGVVWNIQ
jgi:hypothetical protein